MPRSSDLFRALNLMPSVAVWRFEVGGAVRTGDPVDKQVDEIFRHGRLAECNDAMARMYGEERAAALVDKPLVDIMPNVPHNREYLKRFIESGYRISDEESHQLDTDNQPRVYIHNFVGVVEDGLLVSAVGTQLDATNQRQHELLLRQSDERLRLALAAAGMGTWRVDLRTGINTQDESLSRILGLGEGERTDTLKTEFLRLVHPDDRERVQAAIGRALQRGIEYSEEMRIVRPDGSVRWIRDRGRVVTDASGTPLFFTGAVMDITEQRRAEEHERLLGAATAALASSPEYEHTLAEVAAAIVPRFAAACAVQFVHDDRLQLVASAGDMALLPDAEQVMKVVTRGMRIAEERSIVVPLRAGGCVFGAMIFGARGAPQAFDDDDRAFALQLADYVALAVDHARLFRDLQQASRLRDEFLATLSHELRTPLNAVLGWTRMLRRGTVPPERTDAVLDTIERNAAAQMQLVEELLDLSAMVAGSLRLNVTRVDVRELLGGAVETIRPAADAKSLHIKLSIDPDVPEVAGDPGRLRQVIWNLLANAVKFTPPGGAIELLVSRGPADIELRVRDSGQGIAADFLPHVFEAFRQADSSSTRQVGGLGLGLAIVRHIVEAHGGTVGVNSDGVGRGATFSIRLPTGRAPMASHDDSDTGLALLRGRRVLAVDDDESTQELVATMLLMYGVSVRTAGRAEQALTILSTWQPDVLLADLAMPGEDGYALVRRVRAMPLPLGSIPAVALTAYTDPQSVQNAFAAGFDAHLGKPLEPHVLADALTKVLRTRRSP
jgi:PAS domain S-box-containing protein